MHRLFLVRFAIATTLIAFLFATPMNSMAQSTIDLVVHYVEGTPAETDIAYDVNVYLSVVDSVGNPVKDLTPEALTVTEDSQKVEVKNLVLAKKETVNVVLVMDTSGSMGGPGVAAAKTAASNFVAGLGPSDRVAVVTFDNIVKTQIDFTTDLQAARNQIDLIDATRGAGTCLYDAAYQSIQMASTLPSGGRAVVVFTDGVDETPSGAKCSTHTTEDVIGLATAGGTRTPVYTMGVGNRLDENNLKRLADLTGGRYLYSPDSTQVESLFMRLSDQLSSQYILTYTSRTGPGAHTLAVSANYLNAQDSDTRNFLLPTMPTRVSFLSPVDGETVEGTLKIAVALTGQGESVDRVAFEAGGKVIGADETLPYEYQLDVAGYPAGVLDIVAVVYGANDSELAKQSITVTVGSGVDASPVESEPQSAPTTNVVPIVGFGLGGLLLLSVVLFAVFAARRRRNENASQAVGIHTVAAGDRGMGKSDRTIDDWELSPDALGMLIVESSDDPSMSGHRFEITKTVTTMGRSMDNDVTFPKDKPVSRQHAEIVKKRDGLYLMEVESLDSTGVSKTPTYGTFINDVQLAGDPILLQTGDEIRLGKRVKLRFEAAVQAGDSDALTYDGIMSTDDPDRTNDQS